MKPPAAGPVRKLSADGAGERRGHACVDGVAALFEHPRARLRGQRMTRGDGALHAARAYEASGDAG